MNNMLFALYMFLIALAINVTWILSIKIRDSINLYRNRDVGKKKDYVKIK
ncbi:hypothetical protein [Bacillus clarus]|uniref:Uncharacterized protein n=1 Tax=Bacillus clarus TaxID=2338372 RepID=A0A090Y8P4_9BACI|nr:hypothetical protein [Bacillus clarus]KFM94854.1 hypothetical protein DJ93_6015 [Bacillus clarus]